MAIFTTWQVYSQGSSEQKPIKNLWEKGSWAYPGTAQIFWVPPIISGTGNATNFNFGRYSYGAHPNKSPLKIWEKREWCGHIQVLPKFFEYPLLSQERVKLRTSNLADVFRASMQTKPLNYLGEKGAWAYPGTAQISWVPLLSQERVKLRISNFVRTFLVSIRTKRPLQISGKVAVG